VVHLRIVAPPEIADHTLDLLCQAKAVYNVIHLPGAASKPAGDVILCDVAREEASVILGDLRELDIPAQGSIAIEDIDSEISDVSREAERAAPGMPSDAVVWEEVQQRTSENTELSASFLLFMVLAMLIAAVGVLQDSPVLIIGAMVVGPEFGPLAGLCVAIVQRQQEMAKRSLSALAVGFPVGILATFLMTLLYKETGIGPSEYPDENTLTAFISNPDYFSFWVAFLAGTAGVLSLTSTKSGALIGVLISVTTIPAAANIAVAAAYADWGESKGAATQLGVNLASIIGAGLLTLYIQRRYYLNRRIKHLQDPAREAAGLPIGRSARATSGVQKVLDHRAAGGHFHMPHRHKEDGARERGNSKERPREAGGKPEDGAQQKGRGAAEPTDSA
jgi:uncharacterized hydrophobic protein (TIGR00271 family)